MNDDNFIKKLENLKTPKVETQSHKEQLRRALLNSGHFKEKQNMFWTKRLVPATIALILIAVLSLTVVNPMIQEARAMEIAKNDPRVKELIQEYGIDIQEVKLQDGKAYVLLTFPEEKLPEITGDSPVYGLASNAAGESIFFTGSVLEIDLKQEKVSKVELLSEQSFVAGSLTTTEKVEAIEILKQKTRLVPDVEALVPDIDYMPVPIGVETKTSVKLIPSYRYHLETDSATGQVKAVPDIQIIEDKRVNVIIGSDNEQQIVTVNLTQDKIEGSMTIEETITSSVEYVKSTDPSEGIETGSSGPEGIIEVGGEKVYILPMQRPVPDPMPSPTPMPLPEPTPPLVPMPMPVRILPFETNPAGSGQTEGSEGFIESETAEVIPSVQSQQVD